VAKLIIGIVVIWGALWLLGVGLRVFSELASATRQQWDRTQPGRARVGNAVAYPLGALTATMVDLRLISTDIAITLVVAVLLLAGADSATLISWVDGLGGKDVPLLGWAILGGVAGIVMGTVSRMLELGRFDSAAILRVPDIGHLHAGEEAAARHFKIRSVAAVGGVAVLVSALVFSYSRNAEYDPRAAIDENTAVIATAGAEGKIGILNGALEDSTRRLQSDPKSGLKILVSLQSLSREGANPEVERVSKVAQKYLDVFRVETEKLVNGGKPDALARSEAFLEVNRLASVKWLGRLYEAGWGGANKDLSKAFSFYGEAATAGDKAAAAMQDNLAHVMISAKDDVSRQEAFKYLELRARSGGPSEHYWLGQWYLGSGKATDQKSAEKRLARVLAQDIDTAVKNLAFSSLVNLKDLGPAATEALDEQAPKYANGKDQTLKKTAYAYLERRANAGDPGSMLWMGFGYAEGDGVPKDATKAHDWFLKAALQNENQAVKNKAFEALGEGVLSKTNQNESEPKPTVKSPPVTALKNNAQDSQGQLPKPIVPEPQISKLDAANKTIAIPSNSKPSYNKQGWECDGPAYKQAGDECRLTVKPANSGYSYNKQGWECNGPAYKQVGDECRLTVKPADSGYSYNKQGWECNGPAYKQVGDECRLTVSAPRTPDL
jgi:TPR repeat protein